MGTKLEVYCCNCKEHILEADTDTLAQPIDGSMFKVRPDREWWLYFDAECKGHNLTCPMCAWPFHVEQSLLVRKAPPPPSTIPALDVMWPKEKDKIVDIMVEGKPKKLVNMFAPPPPEPKPEAVTVTPEPPKEQAEKKPKHKRGFFKDTRRY